MNLDVDYKTLCDEYSYQLVKMVSGYNSAIYDAAKHYEPSIIARYVLSLAQEFNKFYHNCTINNAKDDVKTARLLLVYITQQIIKNSMELLGIRCPVEM